MTNPFEQGAQMTSAAVDLVYGELFTFIAKTVTSNDVDAKRSADSSRPNFDCTGAYVAPSSSMYPHARGSIADDHAQGDVASKPLVSVDNANLTWQPVPGDQVIRQKTGETFEIAKPLPDGVRRTIYRLTAKKRS